MKAYELKLADLGEGLTEATIVKWLVRAGDVVAKNQMLAEVETAKAVVEIPSPCGGTVIRVSGDEGEIIAVGALLAVIETAGEAGRDADSVRTVNPALQPEVHQVASPIGIVSGPDIGHGMTGLKATLAVRKLANDLGIDLGTVTGTGPDGKIVESDVHAAARATQSSQLSPFRRTIARNLTAAWTAPQVTAWGSAPAARLLAAARAEQVPIEALLLRIVLPIIDEMPEFSAHFDGERLSRIGSHDIGFAIDSPKGLIVAVLRNAGSLSRSEIGARTRSLLTHGREGKLTPGDLNGQTFTLSNIGAVGGRYGTSIVPLNTTAMLSVGRAADEVLPVDGKVVIQTMLPLGLSFDHRVIDGAVAQRFLTRVCSAIEQIGTEGTSAAAQSHAT